MNPAFIAELQTRLRQAVEAYTAGGRRFEALDSAALQKRFGSTLKAWCTYPTHRDAACELNDVSCEHLLRRQDVPDEPLLKELSGFLPIFPGLQDHEPMTAIAVVVLQKSDPPGWPALYVPRWGMLLAPRDDRYGDYFAKVTGRV